MIAAAKRAGEFLGRRMALLSSFISDGIDKYDRTANEFVQFNLKRRMSVAPRRRDS